jgi:hypothetical protein
MLGRSTPRRVAALAIALHLAVLCVAALPRTRFREALSGPVDAYTSLTGQEQAWGMYQSLDRHRSEYVLEAVFADGHVELPWGPADAMDARRLYLVEGVFIGADGRALGARLLDVLHARWPTPERPTLLRLRRASTGLRDYQELPGGGVLKPLTGRSEIVRRY